jgi:uncharacterized protein YuzE
MKIRYYPETDTLSIDLVERPGVDAVELSPGVVVDLDAEGHVVGIEIDHASQVADLSRFEAEAVPVLPAASPQTP